MQQNVVKRHQVAILQRFPFSFKRTHKSTFSSFTANGLIATRQNALLAPNSINAVLRFDIKYFFASFIVKAERKE
jgi:hypothetical protein